MPYDDGIPHAWPVLPVDPPAIVESNEAGNQSDVIEIVGTRREQVQKIDRRAYRVKETPHAAQSDSIQLLRGLPAVTITPDDQVMLLGAPNVTVMVGDRPIQGNVSQYLRTLHGSDIERIEVITNPSAQYSPEGTGGIINLVLRKKRDDGLSGSVNGEASSLGKADAGATVKYKHGKWNYEGEAQGSNGRTARSSYHIIRTVENAPGVPPTINAEDGSGSKYLSVGFLSGKATREIDGKTSAYGKVFGGSYELRTNNDIAFRGLTSDFESFDERQRQATNGNFLGFELGLDHKGRTEGETLKATARAFGNPTNHDRFNGNLGEDGTFTIDRREPNRFIDAQIDWVHPIGKKQILSLGAHWFQERRLQRYRFTNDSTDPSLGPNQADRFDALLGTLSAYATFQRQFGSWAVMPGVRVERYSRNISSPGRPSFDVTRTKAFPTLHIERPLTKALDLTLSYSKRIDRAGFNQLRPYPVMVKVNAIDNGNPALKDQSTDAYEINLHYHRKSLDAGVIIYDRETSHLFSSDFSVNDDGLNVITPINAGHQTDRGAEFDISTPLAKRIKGTASVNLFDSRVPIDPLHGRATAETFRYTGNATIEWDGAERRGGIPGDIAQLQIIYSSPSRTFQTRYNGSYWATLSYTHSFSRTLSLTGTVNGLGSPYSRHRLRSGLVQEDFESHDRLPEFKLKLSKTIGSSK